VGRRPKRNSETERWEMRNGRKILFEEIITISNCPQDKNPCNGFNPTPLQIKVFGSIS
jgi:hypothetical protein